MSLRVLVSGAGPAGLTCALALARRYAPAVSVRVIDAVPSPDTETPAARKRRARRRRSTKQAGSSANVRTGGGALAETRTSPFLVNNAHHRVGLALGPTVRLSWCQRLVLLPIRVAHNTLGVGLFHAGSPCTS
jgi:2-polyprenyl-6-methoxyphenol hydroxylase-like FAD-dependent oxidoreductase